MADLNMLLSCFREKMSGLDSSPLFLQLPAQKAGNVVCQLLAVRLLEHVSGPLDVDLGRVGNPLHELLLDAAGDWRQLYKNRSSRKTDSQQEEKSSGNPILLKIV